MDAMDAMETTAMDAMDAITSDATTTILVMLVSASGAVALASTLPFHSMTPCTHRFEFVFSVGNMQLLRRATTKVDKGGTRI